jgi:hypothetical protein
MNMKTGIFDKVWKATCLSGLAILWILTFIYPTFSEAFIANDMGEGILELTTRTDEGFVVRSVTRLRSDKTKAKTIYFCISETKGLVQKCFFGLDREFRNIKEGDRLIGLQYEVAERFHNNKKQVPIGAGKYFYSVKIIRPSA